LRGSAIGGLILVSTHMVNLWFDRFRGRAIAVAMMGLALGGLVIPGAAEQLATAHGWRVAHLALGAGVIGIMLPGGLIFLQPPAGLWPGAQLPQDPGPPSGSP
jgi:MFS family permease